MEIAQKESGDLEIAKCGRFRWGGGYSSTSEGKEKKRKTDLNFRIKKPGREIGKGDFKGLIIDRSGNQEEADAQIDASAKEFRKLESSEENQEEDNQFYEGKQGVQPLGEKLDIPHSETSEEDGAERADRPKKKRIEKANPLEVE